MNVSLINATLNQTEGITQVEVQTADPIFKRLELELPTTEVSQVEAAIAKSWAYPSKM